MGVWPKSCMLFQLSNKISWGWCPISLTCAFVCCCHISCERYNVDPYSVDLYFSSASLLNDKTHFY